MIKLFSKAKDLIYGVAKVFEYIGWGLLLLWVALMFVGTLMRYFFSSPIVFQTDLVSGMLVVFCTFCFAPVFIQGGHIRVDVIIRRLPKKMQDWFWLFADVVAIICTILINVSMIDLIAVSFATNSNFEVSGIPFLPFQLCVPIGISLFGLAVFVDFVEKLYTMITGNIMNVEKPGEYESGSTY